MSSRLLVRGTPLTGVEVREASAEVKTTTATVVKLFTSGIVVQVFLLARDVPADTWNGNGPGENDLPNPDDCQGRVEPCPKHHDACLHLIRPGR